MRYERNQVWREGAREVSTGTLLIRTPEGGWEWVWVGAVDGKAVLAVPSRLVGGDACEAQGIVSYHASRIAREARP